MKSRKCLAVAARAPAGPSAVMTTFPKFDQLEIIMPHTHHAEAEYLLLHTRIAS
jgi:hypothetical protein